MISIRNLGLTAIGILLCITPLLAAKPNIVFIMADDMGYADIGCYGAKDIKTPNIDSIRKEGIKFTDFHVHPRCTPTRAALMTGCHGNRVGINRVIYIDDKWGFHDNEIIIPELLKEAGYVSSIIGKWHLGDWEPFLPINQGFDHQFIRARTIDEEKFNKDGYRITESGKKRYPQKYVFYKDKEIYDRKNDPRHTTELYTDEAIAFIKANKSKPFFLYFAHTIPHIPLVPSPEFKGSSGRGLYGDSVQEMDWSIGEVLKAIHKYGLKDNTLVIFCSDNGPQFKTANTESGGEAGPLRDGKWTSFEGGTRTPFVARWPGKIKAGSQSDDLIGIIDMLPTFCRIADVKTPDDRVIDGVDISSSLFGTITGNPPRETFAYFDGNGCNAFRYKEWKLYLEKESTSGTNTKVIKDRSVNAGALFNLKEDIAESKDLSSEQPEMVEKVKKLADEFLSEFKKTVRPRGSLE